MNGAPDEVNLRYVHPTFALLGVRAFPCSVPGGYTQSATIRSRTTARSVIICRGAGLLDADCRNHLIWLRACLLGFAVVCGEWIRLEMISSSLERQSLHEHATPFPSPAQLI